MAVGEVVRIRVNPRDAMSVADCVRILGFNYTGMSFSQACAIALSSLLESARNTGVLPEHTGFDYSDIMEPFTMRKRTARKQAISKAINMAGSEFQVPPLIADPQKERRRLRFEELKFKQQNDKLNWTDELQQEFRPLVDEFFQP